MSEFPQGNAAIIYGAGRGIGRVVARTCAREGALVLLVGRTRSTLEATDITSASGMTGAIAIGTCGLVVR